MRGFVCFTNSLTGLCNFLYFSCILSACRYSKMMILPSGIDDDDDDDCEDDSGGDFCWRLGGRAPKA